MLTIHEVPKDLERDYASCQSMAKTIYRAVGSMGQKCQLTSNVNLFEFARGKVVFIEQGILKLTQGDKVLRLYSEGDIVLSGGGVDSLYLGSEFLSDIIVFDSHAFVDTLRSNSELFKQWVALQDLENRVNLRLMSTFIEEKATPALELKPFKDGEAIILEGSEPSEIYEMISGSATVYLKDVKVGTISSGEIFGEMSFLMNSTRTATVKARGPCCVRVVKKDDFYTLLESDAHLSAAISKTLAKRIVEVNSQVVD